MPLEVQAQPVPLTTDDDGVVKIRGSRVTLDTVAEAFDQGATAEEIVQQYPTLQLADVYAVIAYYLGHRTEVGEYRARRERQADDVRRRVEAQQPPDGIRERLMARRARG
jgi:uncharacterized protein (DUF433 family)